MLSQILNFAVKLIVNDKLRLLESDLRFHQQGLVLMLHLPLVFDEYPRKGSSHVKCLVCLAQITLPDSYIYTASCLPDVRPATGKGNIVDHTCGTFPVCCAVCFAVSLLVKNCQA